MTVVQFLVAAYIGGALTLIVAAVWEHAHGRDCWECRIRKRRRQSAWKKLRDGLDDRA